MTIEFADSTEKMSDTLYRTIASIEGQTITLRQLMTAMGEQGFLFLCALLTLPFLIPVSIPGVSTVFGAAIIMISLAIILNRMPWLPARLLNRQIETEKLVPTLRKGADMVSKLDRFVRPRLRFLTMAGLANRLNGAAIMYGGILLMFPLGLIPFSNTLPGVAILLLAIGMLQRDGMTVLAGYFFLLATTLYFGVLVYAAYSAGQGLSGFFV
ncbi:protein exod [Metarhizobium album]|uniref:Protein exod n=1 Tax=Metarhizobium album TaxID=2182425 RepID=A0A2U2DU33_9HYPH|nr:exopolysaccharide biosynthesis protein [Rhizobium album]PWE56814.1 protein exod [Rhizobium album]